ncbi:MAG: methyltransferase domain-containing protein, partial [Anaerolineales bacterium]|nr:methyltransferase domain-containing protein [Anaerolineales bacterium]
MTEKNLIGRIKEEWGHWLRSEWTFEDVAFHWDRTEDYDDINRGTYSYFRRFVDGLKLSDLGLQQRVLDFCARTGNGTTFFFENGKVGSAVCADVSQQMGEICIRRLHEAGLKDFIWTQVLDYTLPFADAAFDAVLCFETVEHFPKPERIVEEIGRVTRPGGSLILTTPNVLWEPIHALAAVLKLHHSEGPHRFIRFGRLLDMVEGAGFSIDKVETTVLVPAGPELLLRFGEWVEERTRGWLMPLFGLRRVIVARKKAVEVS